MTDRTEIFLGIVAVSTLAMAVAQIGVVVAAGLAVRRAARFVDRIEAEVKPLLGHLNAIGREASRSAALASAQVERADRLFGEIAARIEESLERVQASLGKPAREGRAILSGFRAAFQALRELRENGRGRQSRSDDEDALFI